MPIRTRGTQPPLFCLHGQPVRLAGVMRPDRPVYALNYVYRTEDNSPLPATIEKLAAEYIEEIRTVQPTGPYYLFGFSAGGSVAFEMARQLIERGEQVGQLFLAEPTLSPLKSVERLRNIAAAVVRDGPRMSHFRNVLEIVLGVLQRRPRAILHKLRNLWYSKAGTTPPEELRWLNYIAHLNSLLRTYTYVELDCRGEVMMRHRGDDHFAYFRVFWNDVFKRGCALHVVRDADGHHDLMSVEVLRKVAQRLDLAASQPG